MNGGGRLTCCGICGDCEGDCKVSDLQRSEVLLWATEESCEDEGVDDRSDDSAIIERKLLANGADIASVANLCRCSRRGVGLGAVCSAYAVNELGSELNIDVVDGEVRCSSMALAAGGLVWHSLLFEVPGLYCDIGNDMSLRKPGLISDIEWKGTPW